MFPRSPLFVGPQNAWNPNDKSASVTLSNANLTALGVGTSSVNVGARGLTYRSAGKFYFEAVFDAVGTSYPQVGVADASWSLSTFLGSDLHGISIGQDGTCRYNNTPEFSTTSFSVSSFAGIAFDLDNKRFWARNGTGIWNNNASADPATNVGGVDITTLAAAPLFLAVGFNDSSEQITLRLNGTFGGSVPAGFFLLG